jgi:hypothetical protein
MSLDDEILRAGDRRATSRHVQKFRNEKLMFEGCHKREGESKISINTWGHLLRTHFEIARRPLKAFMRYSRFTRIVNQSSGQH